VYERRRARILLAVLTLAALAFVTIDARAGEDNPVDRVRDGAHTVFGPLQDGLATALRPVTAAVDGVNDLLRLRTDNERLRAELERERERRRTIGDVERENEELRALLEMREGLVATSDEYETIGARVIALAPSNFEWTIVLDVGERDGVRRGMTVVSGDGLVGRVVQTSETASRVMLAIDRSFSAAVRIARTGEHGYLEGGGTEPFTLNLLDPEADVHVGDEIVTSTYEYATFPDGLPVGVVTEAGEAGGMLSRRVEVAPFVDFTRLDHVLVILRAPPAAPLPEPAEVGEGATDPGVGDSFEREDGPLEPPGDEP
jgi:rod shape-determining protein MreC